MSEIHAILPEPLSPAPDPSSSTSKEPAPMLEVHPPHTTPHTWRDFFIHIATITVGLLIALSLEQTVLLFHHREQRHQLEHDLRAEAEKNLRLIDLDNKFYANKGTRLAALRQYVEELITRRTHGLPAPTEPPPDLGSPIFAFPRTSVWETAKESSLISLLPREEAAMFQEVYFENDRTRTFADRYFEARSDQRKFEVRFERLRDPNDLSSAAGVISASALARMNPDELKQYSALVSDAIETLEDSRFVTELARNSSQAVLNGARTPEELEKHLGDGTVPDRVPK
jgi:hypothetical protein